MTVSNNLEAIVEHIRLCIVSDTNDCRARVYSICSIYDVDTSTSTTRLDGRTNHARQEVTMVKNEEPHASHGLATPQTAAALAAATEHHSAIWDGEAIEDRQAAIHQVTLRGKTRE